MRESFLGQQKDGAGITMTWNPDYKPSLRSSWLLTLPSLFISFSWHLCLSLGISVFALLCLLTFLFFLRWSIWRSLRRVFIAWEPSRKFFSSSRKYTTFFFRESFRELDITNHIVLFSTRLFSPLLFSALPFSTLPFSILFFFHLSFFVCSTPPHTSSVCSSLLPFSTLLFSILLYFSLPHSTLADATRLYSALLYSTQPDSIPFFVLLFLHALNKEGSLNFFWC